MEPDINNMTLNEYLIYEDRNRNLARSYPSMGSVTPVRNRIWVYPDSDEEDEEYYSLLTLLPCCQTLQPFSTINFVLYNNCSEVDIKNMTLEEYARYELTISTMKSEMQVPTHGFASHFFNQLQHTPNPPLDKEDSIFDEILDDLFIIGADNIRNLEHEIPNRCDDETDKDDINISIIEEKEEAPMLDVEMDEDQDIDHSGTEDRL
ncbi:hypothetical protein Tco_0097239 [Tanacetum coccineum]